jgi:hypothetical protein
VHDCSALETVTKQRNCNTSEILGEVASYKTERLVSQLTSDAGHCSVGEPPLELKSPNPYEHSGVDSR